MSAARFAVLAERAVPLLVESETILATEFSRDMSAESRGALARAKLSAKQDIETFRVLLYPEGDE